MSPKAFAISFASKLGLPHLYDYETTPPGAMPADEFTIGGGQPMTCRDIARIGQLLVKPGRRVWRAAAQARHRSLSAAAKPQAQAACARDPPLLYIRAAAGRSELATLGS